MKVSKSNFNRLAKALMERYDLSSDAAVSRLESFRLQLICDETIRESAALQAALITALNAGRRAYLGGVSVIMPENVRCLLPSCNNENFNDILKKYEDIDIKLPDDLTKESESSRLFFGPAIKGHGGLRVLCDGWRGGVIPIEEPVEFNPISDFALGGVLAGGLSVAQAFLNISGLDNIAGHDETGLSVWNPDIHWLDGKSSGPLINAIPKKLWLIGLGHLGQAYLWTLGLLKGLSDKPMEILLQDFDSIEESNWSSGLLCEKTDFGKHKTRVCSDWLESRGFKTRITERYFDENTMRANGEPYVALCGVDNAKARSLLENCGFDLVVESGLGGSLSDFDRIMLHTFPNKSCSASKKWADTKEANNQIHERIRELSEEQGDCGILARILADVAVSTAFVGAVAASLVVGELLKALHGGKRTKVLHIKLRDICNLNAVFFDKPYSTEMGKNGLIGLKEVAVNI